MALSEDITKPIMKIFADYDKVAEKLGDIPKNAETKTTQLLALFDGDIFEEPVTFLTALNGLSEEVGHAYHTVLRIELEREAIKPKANSESFPVILKKEEGTSPQTIIQTQPQKGGGFWDYAGTRRMAKVWEKYLVAKPQAIPQISTGKEVIDILDFGRQLIPEFNRVHDFYQQSLDHLHFFPDEQTKTRLQTEIAQHLNKLAGIIRTFCKTISEYRKDLIGEQKANIAKGIMALKMAEFQAFGGMDQAGLYKAVREAAGSQDAAGGKR